MGHPPLLGVPRSSSRVVHLCCWIAPGCPRDGAHDPRLLAAVVVREWAEIVRMLGHRSFSACHVPMSLDAHPRHLAYTVACRRSAMLRWRVALVRAGSHACAGSHRCSGTGFPAPRVARMRRFMCTRLDNPCAPNSAPTLAMLQGFCRQGCDRARPPCVRSGAPLVIGGCRRCCWAELHHGMDALVRRPAHRREVAQWPPHWMLVPTPSIECALGKHVGGH